jgi:hypothetical protein
METTMKNKVDYGPFTTMETIEAVRDGLNQLSLTQRVEAIRNACSESQLTELAYQLTLLALNLGEDHEHDDEEEEQEQEEPSKQDRGEFLAFCRAATDDQLQNIYSKELHHKRMEYATLAVQAAAERGIWVDPNFKWTGEDRPV